MFSTVTERGAAITLDALALGCQRLRYQAQQHGQPGGDSAPAARGADSENQSVVRGAGELPAAPSSAAAAPRACRQRSRPRAIWLSRTRWPSAHHRRAERAGRICRPRYRRISRAHCDRAAHAGVVYALAGGAVEPEVRAECPRRGRRRSSETWRRMDCAGRLPYDRGEKGATVALVLNQSAPKITAARRWIPCFVRWRK